MISFGADDRRGDRPYYYAQIDESNVCVAVLQAAEPKNSLQTNLIPLFFFRVNLIGRTWNGNNWAPT